MKKIKVKANKRNNIVISYNVNKVITINGAYSFDDIRFEYAYGCNYQYLYLFKFGIVVTTLVINTNDFIRINSKEKTEYTAANRNLEYLIYKYRQLSKGGE